MKNEQALILTNSILDSKPKKNKSSFELMMEDYYSSVKKALEKQIPKKPYNTDGYVDDKKIGIHYCDSCGHFVFYSDRFCNKCGQYQDWGDEE